MCWFFVIQRRITLVKTRARRSCPPSQFWKKCSRLPGVVRFDYSQRYMAQWFHPAVEPRDFDAKPTRGSGPEETVACTTDSVPLSWSEQNLFTTPTDFSKRCGVCSEGSAAPDGLLRTNRPASGACSPAGSVVTPSSFTQHRKALHVPQRAWCAVSIFREQRGEDKDACSQSLPVTGSNRIDSKL